MAEAQPDGVKRATAALADRLHSAAIHLLRHARRQDARAGVGPARLSALSVLVFGGPRTVSELAAAEGVRLPTISRLVKALERDGLVTREADDGDARLVRLRSTPVARRVLQAARERRIADLAARLAALTADDLAALERAAGLLEHILDARPAPTDFAQEPTE